MFPRPVPNPVLTKLLKMRKTSLAVELPGSVRMASPAIAAKGNWRRIFSGMRHVVKSAAHCAIGAAAAGTGNSIRQEKNKANVTMRTGMVDFSSLLASDDKCSTGRSQ
jgi:hypothetical protein